MTRIRFNDRIVIWPASLSGLAFWKRGTLIAKLAIMDAGRISFAQRELAWKRSQVDGSFLGARSYTIWKGEERNTLMALAKLELRLPDGTLEHLGWIGAGAWCVGQNRAELKKAIIENWNRE